MSCGFRTFFFVCLVNSRVGRQRVNLQLDVSFVRGFVGLQDKMETWNSWVRITHECFFVISLQFFYGKQFSVTESNGIERWKVLLLYSTCTFHAKASHVTERYWWFLYCGKEELREEMHVLCIKRTQPEKGKKGQPNLSEIQTHLCMPWYKCVLLHSLLHSLCRKITCVFTNLLWYYLSFFRSFFVLFSRWNWISFNEVLQCVTRFEELPEISRRRNRKLEWKKTGKSRKAVDFRMKQISRYHWYLTYPLVPCCDRNVLLPFLKTVDTRTSQKEKGYVTWFSWWSSYLIARQ